MTERVLTEENLGPNKIINVLLGPLFFFIVLYAPLGLAENSQKFLAVFFWVVAWWLGTSIPLFLTGVWGLTLAGMLGVASAKEIFAPFGNPIIFLFLGGFFLAKAMQTTGLDLKISRRILALPTIRGNSKRTFLMVFLITAVFSMWVSNTATTAMMLPVVLGLFRQMKIEDALLRSKILVALAHSATIGGLMTPVGSPPNLIALGFLDSLAGIKVTFIEWCLVAVPIGIIMLVAVCWITLKKTLSDEAFDSPYRLPPELAHQDPIKGREWLLMGAFSLTVIGWFLPGIVDMANVKGPFAELIENRFAPAFVALVFSGLLFVLPVGKKGPILNAAHAKSIDWPTLALFGAGLSLGSLLFKTGLGPMAAEGLLGLGSLALLGPLIVAATVVLTEFTSNTASANVLVPLVIAAAAKAGMPPTALAVGVAMACDLAFMLPVATPPNAIVYGSEEVNLKDMLRQGAYLNALGIILLSIMLLIWQSL